MQNLSDRIRYIKYIILQFFSGIHYIILLYHFLKI